MNIQEVNLETWQVILIFMVVVWDLVWKSIALWRSARNNQTGWFVVILLLNTVGILPIIYLLTNKANKK